MDSAMAISSPSITCPGVLSAKSSANDGAMRLSAMEDIDLLNVIAANRRHKNLPQAWTLNMEIEYRATSGLFTNDPYHRGLAECLYWRGKFYSIHKQYHKALPCFFQALIHCREAEQNELSPNQMIAALYEEAPDYFLKTRLNVMALHNILGVTLILMALFEDGLQHYLQAWHLARTVNDTWMLALLCNNIAYAYRLLDQPREAAPYIERGLTLLPHPLTTAGEMRLRATMLGNACGIATCDADYSLAHRYAEEALCLYTTLRWEQGQAEILLALGTLYEQVGDHAAARASIERAMLLSMQNHLVDDWIAALIHSARLISIEDAVAAQAQLHQALMTAEEQANLRRQYQCHEAIAVLYEQQQSYQQALIHYQHFHRLKEQVFTDRSDERVSILRTLHQTERALLDTRWYQDYAATLEGEIRQRMQVQAELEWLATTDGLTKVLNRRAFDRALLIQFEQAVQTGHPLAVVLIDVDHFKAYNDSYGHPAGDVVLQQVAQLLTASARGADLVARYGGEEFVLLLPNTTAEQSLRVAERCRETIASATWNQRSVTISAGVAVLHDGVADLGDFIGVADQALYQAKLQGRNQVVVASTGLDVQDRRFFATVTTLARDEEEARAAVVVAGGDIPLC